MARPAPQEDEHVTQRRLGLIGRLGNRLRRLRTVLWRQLEPPLAPHVFEQSRGHVGDLEHPIHHPGVDGLAGHGVVLGFLGVLGNRQAAAFLDALDPDGPVAVRAREHDGDGVWTVRIGQRAEEHIDGHALAAFGLQVGQPQVAVHRGQVLARGNDVDVIGL